MNPLRAVAEAALVVETGAASVVRQCPQCGSTDHGRPFLVGSDLQVSIAYAGDVAAIAWGKSPVGIDLELADAVPPVGLDVRGWTRLEALGKAGGAGVRDWPRSLPADLPTEPLTLPQAYVGTLAGLALGWRLLESPDQVADQEAERDQDH